MKRVDFESIAAVEGDTLALAEQDSVYTFTDATIPLTAQSIV